MYLYYVFEVMTSAIVSMSVNNIYLVVEIDTWQVSRITHLTIYPLVLYWIVARF